MNNFSFAVLISGNGSNLQAMIDAIEKNKIDGSICCVLSNNPKAYGLHRAKKVNIPTEILDHKKFSSRENFDQALLEVLNEFKPDLVVLAGFMRILSKKFVNTYIGRLLNVHPSLLPKYPGLNTHEKVLKSGDKHHGITVHFVDDSLDGGPICAQSRFEIRTNSKEQIVEQIHNLEKKLYPKVINWFAEGRLKLHKQRVLLDGKEITL